MKTMKSMLVALFLAVTVLTVTTLPAASAAITRDLIAGQTIDVGDIVVSNVGAVLTVEVETTGDWYITEIHVHVAKTIGEFPLTKQGNPKIGHFTVGNAYDPATQDTGPITLPLPDGVAVGEKVWVAVHAAVQTCTQEETAWGRCTSLTTDFPGRSWATLFGYTVE